MEKIKMKTEFIMEISFIFENDNKRIAGPANSNYSIQNLSWLDFINKNIIIKTKNGNFIFKVKKIDIFSSIYGSFNIGLTLYDNIKFNCINIGDKVYKIIY